MNSRMAMSQKLPPGETQKEPAIVGIVSDNMMNEDYEKPRTTSGDFGHEEPSEEHSQAVQIIDKKNEAGRYAQEFAKVGIKGNRYLAFREVKGLVDKYVRGKETLDYGCGCGISSRFLRDLGLNVHGVDVNEDMIKLALQSDVDGRYSAIKSGSIPASDDTYDLVFSSWVMLEVSTKSELMKIGKEIGRVLKPDGIFMMIVCNKDTYNNDWLTVNTEFEENRELRSGCRVRILFKDINLSIFDYFWTEEDYKEMLMESGLQLLEMNRPLGKDSDGIEWKLERSLSPVTIYVAKKKK